MKTLARDREMVGECKLCTAIVACVKRNATRVPLPNTISKATSNKHIMTKEIATPMRNAINCLCGKFVMEHDATNKCHPSCDTQLAHGRHDPLSRRSTKHVGKIF